MGEKYRYIYGPVSSWRLGSSLGIDPISCEEKVCTFDCVYCQVDAKSASTNKREVFVSTQKIIEEIKNLPPLKIDYITFSGRGEPTLAKNLGEIIKEIKKIREEKIAVITNSSLMDRSDVKDDLYLADFVMVKLDAHSENLFQKINRPMKTMKFKGIIKGIKDFRAGYRGKLALQIMFIEENKTYAKDLAQIAREIDAFQVQLNTPLRPCGVKPLGKEELDIIKKYFEDMKVLSPYETQGHS
jgi:wyosine [tRNA(Phe)-imidazoG37] synthetase (radical SAM superfamily)